MRNLADLISLVALLPGLQEEEWEGKRKRGVWGGVLVFSPCLQVTALLFSEGLCFLSRRRAAAAATSPASAFLPPLLTLALKNVH